MHAVVARFSEAPLPRCQLCAARGTCFIGQLPRAQQERLDPMIRERAFRKTEVLLTEADQPREVCAIKVGSVMLTRRSPDAQDRPVALVARGHLLGLESVFDEASPVGAEAAYAGRICVLPADTLQAMLKADAALLQGMHRRLTRAFAAIADWGQVMRMRTVPRQLMAALMLMAREQGSRTVQLPSQVALAALLSTTRESVARGLRHLHDAGHLNRVDRWHVELTGTHRQVFQDAETAAAR